MNWTLLVRALAGALAALALDAPVNAATLYSISRDDALLRTIDPDTGATLASIPLTHPFGTVLGGNGLAADPTTNTLWAILRVAEAERTQRELARIDAATGVVTAIGNTEHAIAAIAFDAAGVLYGVIGNAGSPPETMVTLSKTDASAPIFMPLGNGGDGEAIAFSSFDGLMYHWSGLGAQNVTEIAESIDLQSKTTAPLTITGADYDEALAGTFEESTRSFLLSADYFDAKLYRVRLRGPLAAVSLIGDLDHQSKGLAFLVPEPATFVTAMTLALWLAMSIGRCSRPYTLSRLSSRRKRSIIDVWFSNERPST